jgi:DNA-binding NarL/FixJ family response regulator
MDQRSFPGRRALIVEDEPMIALDLEAEMHALGFGICQLAAEPQEAFLLAMGDQLDVVLMNVDLQGGHDGIKAARWLREVSDAPIVFITGYTDRERHHRAHSQTSARSACSAKAGLS